MIRCRPLSELGGVALATLLCGCSSPSDDRNAKSPDDAVESERRETVPAGGEPAPRSLPAPEVEPDDDDGFDPDDEEDRPDLPEELPEVIPPEREDRPGGRPPEQVPP